MTFIVGFGHTARVGKDTAAQALCRDEQFVRIGFADPLRELAMGADPIVTAGGSRPQNVALGHGRFAHAVHGLGYEGAKDTYKEVRAFLQRLGVAARDVFGDDFWVEQASRRFVRHDRVVVPDVRFVNEAVAVQALGGKVIRIDRPGFAPVGHRSETELADFDGWDAVLVNDGSVVDLERQVVELVRGWLRPDATGAVRRARPTTDRPPA